jgi:hypothetical protein
LGDSKSKRGSLASQAAGKKKAKEVGCQLEQLGDVHSSCAQHGINAEILSYGRDG